MSNNSNAGNVSLRSTLGRALTWTELDQNFTELKNVIADSETKVDETDYATDMADVNSRLDNQKYRQIPVIETFSGDGINKVFTLTSTILDSNNIFVYINDEYLSDESGNAYSISGNTLTFATAPASGTNNVDIVNMQTMTEQHFSGGAISKSANGYNVLPSGLIIQWGTWTSASTAGNPTIITFTKQFPNAILSITGNATNNATTNSQIVWFDNLNTINCNGHCDTVSVQCSYIAIGY